MIGRALLADLTLVWDDGKFGSEVVDGVELVLQTVDDLEVEVEPEDGVGRADVVGEVPALSVDHDGSVDGPGA